jgi:WD40 repeat-containing protein SMU1
MTSLEIDSKDVIRLMLQFMKENNLSNSMRELQLETDVTLNTVDNLEAFVSDIQKGHWDSVMAQVSSLKLPTEKLISLYEHVVLETLEMGERDLARELLRSTEPMNILKTDQPERYLKLEHLCQRPFFNANEAYEMGSSKEKRRREIAESLTSEVSVVPPSRLMSLLGQALRFQLSQGMLPKGDAFDLFSGGRRTLRKEIEEKIPRKQAGIIRFSKESHPETAIFSPDGQSLVTGSVDGFIELWDWDTCKLRKDLDYQMKDELMMHEEAVLCSGFSRDAEYLATGSQGGKLKVWKVSTGVCIRRFNQAHLQGITSVTFSRDGSQVLTTSFDHTARIHGLKSGKTLKEFRGHTSYVNNATFSKDGTNVLTVSSDGTAKLWEARTTECLLTFRPGMIPGSALKETTIHTILLMPNNPDQIFVCPKASQAYLMTPQGQVVRTFSSGKQTGGDFLCATVSPQGKWIYCVGEDGVCYVFDSQGGQLENVLPVADREVIGIAHHPQRNLLATITDDGQLKLWKP